MSSLLIRLAAVLSTVTAVACGGDDDGGSTALEGIYELASWTHNPDSCDSEGPADFEESNYTHFFVKFESFFGEAFLTAVFCSEVDVCRADAADDDTIHIGNFAFDGGDDVAGWTGRSFVLSIGDTSCSGSVYQARLTGDPGASVRIDEETRTVSDVPLDDMGECQDQVAYDQAAGLPCEELSVVMGTFVEAI